MAESSSTSITVSGPSPAVLIVIGCPVPVVGGEASVGDDALMRACSAARARGEAMAALLASIADLPPADPRHEAAHAAAATLRPAWESDVAVACGLRAKATSGLRAKAELAATLFDRESDGTVVGGPAVRLAASVTDDLLGATWHRA